ncbi:hypothetical protein LPV64_07060, partial [Ralstonia pseudosolanacearum]|nr:hypothetical protein [Ralstonia pseudosolanacearum]
LSRWLDPKDWLDRAKALDEGRSTRIQHGCGPGKVLAVYHHADRWSAYCFRCGEPGVVDKPVESLSERIARRAQEREVDDALTQSVDLPSPVNFDVESWPTEARVWLYKASLDRTDIAKLGVYLHEPSSRVVVPVFERERLVYWQARSVDGRQPKYINPQVNRQRLVAKFGRGDPLVLTEDVLSTYRVGQHTEAWSLMGTKLTDYIAADILKRGGRVLVWLDPDWQYPAGERPGVIAAKKITNQLRSMGVQVERIVSRADPKLLSRREISCVLTHHNPHRSTELSNTGVTSTP